MTDKKFTQEQIIKGLECCGFTEDCSGCPFYSDMGCDENIHANALDLIHRLKTRIVRYQLKNTNQRNALASLNKKVAEQKAEIERLNKKLDESLELATNFEADLNNRDAEIKDLKAEIERLTETPISQDTIDGFKADVIKKFAYRLKVLYMNDVRFYRKTKDIVEKDLKRIDNLVKEMTEVDK